MRPFVNLMCETSSVMLVQLFLAVQNSSFCIANSFTFYRTYCYFSRYFLTAANERKSHTCTDNGLLLCWKIRWIKVLPKMFPSSLKSSVNHGKSCLHVSLSHIFCCHCFCSTAKSNKSVFYHDCWTLALSESVATEKKYWKSLYTFS